MNKIRTNDTVPGEFVNHVRAAYQNILDHIPYYRNIAISQHRWPDWCYFPAYMFGEVLRPNIYIPNEKEHDFENLVDMHIAASSWLQTKTIYKFDRSLSSELADMDFDDIPSEVLLRVPEQCFYVDVSESEELCRSKMNYARGFFVYIDAERDGDSPQMTVLSVYGDFNSPSFGVFSMPLHKSTLKESIRHHIETGKENSVNGDPEKFVDNCVAVKSAQLNHILYLCSDEPDITENCKHYKTNNRKTSPFVYGWGVGVRIGAAIREYSRNEEAKRSYEINKDGVRKRPRPHVRRAHWSHYWTGSKKFGERVRIAKWLPASYINVSSAADLPTTIRAVNVSE